MLKLDPFSERILFECDRCRREGELVSQIVEEEGEYFCWNCLKEVNKKGQGQKEMELENREIKKMEYNRDSFFECGRCRIQGERKSFAVEEGGACLCISCWLEKENTRLSKYSFFSNP